MTVTLRSDIRTRQPEGAAPAVAPRRRILVVDDDAAVLDLLSVVLERVDADIETCSDPEAAMARFREEAFDVVISDERMPKMSGSEMLRRLRALSPRTPTILLTAYASSRSLAAAYERSGVFGYLAKPFETHSLVGTVQEALRAAEQVG